MAEPTLQSAAFPRLDELQIETVLDSGAGQVRCYNDGEPVWEAGAAQVPFVVVLSGCIEIIDKSGEMPRTIAVHTKGNFSGDTAVLSGMVASVGGVARGECRVYEIALPSFRPFLNNHPVLSDMILQAFIARRQIMRDSPEYTGLRLIGSRFSVDTFRIREFLGKNRVLFTWFDIESDPTVAGLLKEFGLTEADTPVVACGKGMLLRNPSNAALAEKLGIRKPVDRKLYDLTIVGAGPAGLAAAVYAASEGLATLVVERTAPGGQAGASMRIENYLGFPTGLTGGELVDRATVQADKFGARMSVTVPVSGLAFDHSYPLVKLADGETVLTRTVLIASGADYSRLDVADSARFEGAGVYYAANANEARLCTGCTAIVVGGGNSAGQATVFLAQHAAQIFVLIRGDDLYKSMSSYLVHRLEQTPNVKLMCNTVVQSLIGDGHLQAISVRNTLTGEEKTLETPALFSFIGASPRTDWLPMEVERDAKCFVLTGPDLIRSPHWTAKRPPFFLETSRPGVFAAGDCRAQSVKRVATAVGEGAMAVQFVHEYLKTA